MEEVRSRIGDAPVYLSFDIDGLDPAFAPAPARRRSRGSQCRKALKSFAAAAA